MKLNSFFEKLKIISNATLFGETPALTGQYSESLINDELEKIRLQKSIFRNLYLRKEDGNTTEIDLILLLSSGLYIIEAKGYQGWIFGNEYADQWTQTLYKTKTKFYNPVKQNSGHIFNLKKYLVNFPDVPYYSIVVFANAATLKKITVAPEKATVINRRLLLGTIHYLHEKSNYHMNEHRYIEISELLTGFKVDKMTKENHVNYIKSFKP